MSGIMVMIIPQSIVSVSSLLVSAGLYKTTYAGYHNEVPGFFATATPTTANAFINNGGAHGTVEVSASISLTAGVDYPIRIQFGEIGGGDVLAFNYSTATISKTTNVTGKVFYNPITNGF